MFAHHFDLLLEFSPGALPGLLATKHFLPLLSVIASITPAAGRSVASSLGAALLKKCQYFCFTILLLFIKSTKIILFKYAGPHKPFN